MTSALQIFEKHASVFQTKYGKRPDAMQVSAQMAVAMCIELQPMFPKNTTVMTIYEDMLNHHCYVSSVLIRITPPFIGQK